MKNENETARLEFNWYPDDYENVSMTIECSEDIDLYEFKDFCKRFAAAMSYTPESINRVFGGN